jgi:hypothetical protein
MWGAFGRFWTQLIKESFVTKGTKEEKNMS